jgi:hypothetical protein
MGGQACVLYGAAEFSRDTDLAVLAEAENLRRLHDALAELQAECIAVPAFEKRYLDLGLAIHFRCRRADVEPMRIDVMSTMRGVDAFPLLWDRRTSLEVEGEPVEILSLPDLVKAKKTQRDKDWGMVTRLVEASYFANRDQPTRQQVLFWLRELRSPEILIEVAQRFAAERAQLEAERPLLTQARERDEAGLRQSLRDEEDREREADREYWRPLRREIERLRQQQRSGS